MSTITRRIQKNLIHQAWPIFIASLAGVSFGVLDTMMLGNFNAQSLQVISLAASIYITVTVSLMGVIHALIPMFSQLFGANQKTEIGILWGQGIWLAFIISLIVGLALLFPDIWLSISGNIAENVKEEIKTYLRITFFAMPATLMFRAVYALCTSTSRPKLIMYINVASIFIKAFFNWVLIFGHLGLPALGSVGAGLSTLIVSWFTLLFGLWLIFSDTYYHQFSLKLGLPQWKYCKDILKLGIPMGGSYFVEISAFTFMALLAAREGVHVSGAQQIQMNLVALLYMLPQSIGVATAALSAQAIGRQNYIQSHFISLQGLWLGLLGAILTILVIYFGKPYIVSLYTNDPQVAIMAASLLSIVPLFHLLDYFQCDITYILRAHKVATIPFITQAVLLIGLGLGGGYYFGYGAGKGELTWLGDILTPGAAVGVSSLWIMCCAALLLCGFILSIWYYIIIQPHLKKSKIGAAALQ
ncbi:MATE family efflux transporter [Pelistega ratti]|uniref:MATE family efflux transporter n=1 Tax=Pelistega ratti TaxID=2652177 RepID=UPI001358BFE3|nr:MATE family efflux transporter [Pelistega ratti]